MPFSPRWRSMKACVCDFQLAFRGRAREALAIANEVAAGGSVDSKAAVRGGIVAVMCLAELGEIDEARQRLDLLGHEAKRLEDASLEALIREALSAINRKR